MKKPTLIFLSYASQDKEKVLSLYQKLSDEGFSPWMDIENILPGEKRKASIQKAIHEADFFLACLSKISVTERGFFQSQIRTALSSLEDMLDSDIYLIPVRLEQCEMPEYLQELQGADLFKEDGWTQLLKAIEIGSERRQSATESGAAKPSVPESPDTPGRASQVIEPHRSWEVSEQEEGVVLRFPWSDAISKLQFRIESEHFIIHFGLRNPTKGKGLGSDGVRDKTLVNTYVGALERCYKMMISKPWERQPPIVGARGKTTVYVFDTFAFTATNLQMVPYIGLPSGSSEPTSQSESQLATSITIHQVVHLFNFRERPFYDIHSSSWEWFDDALASFMETLVSPENSEYLRLLAEWVDTTGVSLDARNAGNYAIMFIRYMANRMGLEFINRIWVESMPAEKPLETLMRLLPEGQKFASSDPDEHDIFASGYCMDSYFLWDPSSDCFTPQVYERYGDRAVSESLLLGTGESQTIIDVLDHLACIYYRYYPQGQAKRLQISLLPVDLKVVKPLKAEVTMVTKDKRRGVVVPLRIVPSSEPHEAEQLFCDIPLSPEDIDHVVLVVSNCGLRGSASNVDSEHDDHKRYKIVVSVI